MIDETSPSRRSKAFNAQPPTSLQSTVPSRQTNDESSSWDGGKNASSRSRNMRSVVFLVVFVSFYISFLHSRSEALYDIGWQSNLNMEQAVADLLTQPFQIGDQVNTSPVTQAPVTKEILDQEVLIQGKGNHSVQEFRQQSSAIGYEDNKTVASPGASKQEPNIIFVKRKRPEDLKLPTPIMVVGMMKVCLTVLCDDHFVQSRLTMLVIHLTQLFHPISKFPTARQERLPFIRISNAVWI
jgi:hypothetical protein